MPEYRDIVTSPGMQYSNPCVPGNVNESVSNARALQTVLDKIEENGGGRVVFNVPGTYSFRGGRNPMAIIEVGDNTEIEIGAGVIINNLGSAGTASKMMFINKNATSNFVPVVGVTFTHSADPDWWKIVTLNLGATNPYVVGDFVYIRPAYTSPDTTNFIRYIYPVMAVNNSNPAARTITVHMPLGPTAPVPTVGNLITYKANANIKIHGRGYIRQATQVREGLPFNATPYIQCLMNKSINCEIDVQLIESPGSVSGVLANAFFCTLKNSYSTMANGVMIFGNSYGNTIEGVSGDSKDDLIALFTNGANTPFYDGNGTQINSDGDIIGLSIDFQGKEHKNASSRAINFVAAGNNIIDGVTISNYVGRNLNGVPFQLNTTSGAGDGRFGVITLKNSTLFPRRGRNFFELGAVTGNTLTLKKLDIDGLTISTGSVDGTTGLCDGRLVNFLSGGTTVIGEICLRNADVNIDCANTVSASDSALINVSDTSTIDDINVLDSKFTTTGSTKGLWGVNGGTNTSVLRRATFRNVRGGFPYKGFLSYSPLSAVPVDVTFDRCVVTHNLTNGLQNGDLPTNSRVIITDCDFSLAAQGAAFFGGSTTATYSLTFGRNYGNTRPLISNTGSNKTHLIRSSGGNQAAVQAVGGAGNVWTFNGNCSDISAPLAGVTRTAGAFLTASVNAGTILANNVAICDATGAANSWKQLSNTALVF
jgi:hypothetical protein